MAFWGTEVKPGRPFTHTPLNGNGRLRLSGATLGIGSSTQKCIVQCNVGNKRPVFVCCLFPEKAEFCQLDLEFEESDEVVFSVIGPRTVHLSGYYRSSSSLNHLNDESDSYGEDIGETDTERSENSQESEFGGSFINDDDDLQVFPSSPEYSNEERLDLKESKDGKGRRRRLRKRYQLSESENDDSSQQKHFTRAVAAVQVLDSEIEDSLPILSLSTANDASNSGKADVEENATLLDGTNAAIGAQPESESGSRNEEKAKKEKGNLNSNAAEDDATMLDGTNAAIGAQPECESGVRNEEKGNLNNMAGDDASMIDGTNAAIGAQPESYISLAYDESSVKNEEKAKKEKGNLNSNEAKDEATMLEVTNAAIGAQLESESVTTKEEKQKHVLGLDITLMSKNKTEELAKAERFPEGAHGTIGEVVLEENELASKEECKHNDLLLVASQACLEDGAKLKQKRKKHVKEKTLEDNVFNEKKTEELAKVEGFPEDAYGMIGEVVLEQNELASKEECKHNDLLLAASQACLEDGAKLKRKRKKYVKEKTLEDNVFNEKKTEELAKVGGFSEGAHGMIGEVVLEQNELTSKEECKHNDLLLAASQVCLEDGAKLKRKRKKHVKEKTLEDNIFNEKKTEELAKVEGFPEGAHGMIGEVVLEQNGLASKEECKHNDLLLAASQVCLEDGAKLKGKRKRHVKENTLEDNVSNEDERWKSGSNLDSLTSDVNLEDKGPQKQLNDKKRKKKKRCMIKEDGDAMKMEPPVLSANQKEEMEGKNANDSATQLSNLIMIEELEMGKPDGKLASLGKKVHVHYIGKLKESGQVFDSTAGKPLSKFRLGEEKVPELWNVGLDGMRVGGKRRLTVPPSVSYKNEGAGENIPPNSWLVFDVELVKVR